MALESYLTPGENLLASCKGDKGVLYATDRRILVHRAWFREESISDLSYREITSIDLERRPHSTFRKWGVALLVIGLLLAIVFSIFTLGPMKTIGIVLLVLGLALIGTSFALPRSYYRFKGPGILTQEEVAKRWSGSFKNHPEASKLVQAIRERLQ